MKKSKVLLSSFFAIIMSLSLIVGLNINSAKAVTNTALSSVNLTMQKGASARLVENSSGLRFTSLLTKAEYDGLKANTDYTSVEFGMLIMPNEYIVKYGELNEANVFGVNAKYNWKNENAEYVPVEGKTRIINLSRNIMVETSSGLAFNGAIVNILPANYAREFIGVGYIKAVTATTTEYKFATINDNARSIVFVATKALADTSITLTEPEKAILNGYLVGTIKLVTPYSVGDKTFVRYNAPYLEFDRGSVSHGTENALFDKGVDYALIYIYDSQVAGSKELGKLKFINNGDGNGYISLLDGAMKVSVNGVPHDMYINPDAVPEFWKLIKNVLGFSYGSGVTYYFAVQTIAAKTPIENKLYLDSAISKIDWPLCEIPGASTENFNIKIINGAISGATSDTVQAKTGANVKITANIPEGKYFTGWYKVTYNGATEVIGELFSGLKTTEFTVSENLTLKAVFSDTDTRQKLSTLANDKNQVFNWYGGGIAAELLRYGKTPYEIGSDYVTIYIYTSTTANKTDFVGQFRVFSDVNGDRIESVDGLKAVKYDGGVTNMTIQGAPVRGELFPFMAYCIGNTYSNTQSYYFAAQLHADDTSIYLTGDISDIGTINFSI